MNWYRVSGWRHSALVLAKTPDEARKKAINTGAIGRDEFVERGDFNSTRAFSAAQKREVTCYCRDGELPDVIELV